MRVTILEARVEGVRGLWWGSRWTSGAEAPTSVYQFLLQQGMIRASCRGKEKYSGCEVALCVSYRADGEEVGKVGECYSIVGPLSSKRAVGETEGSRYWYCFSEIPLLFNDI